MGIWGMEGSTKNWQNWQVTWCKKEKTVSALSLKYTNMIFSICIYNVIKFFSKNLKNCIKTIDKIE